MTRLHDVITQTQMYTLDGKPAAKIAYPTLGAASTVYGRQTSNHGFYNFESFNIPPAIYHYDVASGKTEVFAKPQVPFDSDAVRGVAGVLHLERRHARADVHFVEKRAETRTARPPR